MKKMIVSFILTVLLGPGAGHIYLREFMRGILLLAATLITGLHFFYRVLQTAPSLDALNKNAAEFFRIFTVNNPRTVLYYDIIFAAIWSFALIDIYYKTRPEPANQPDDYDEE